MPTSECSQLFRDISFVHISRNSWKHSDDGNFQTSDGHIESFDKVQYDACSEALANVWGNRNKVAASACKEIDTSTDDDSQSVENGRQYLLVSISVQYVFNIILNDHVDVVSEASLIVIKYF